MSYQVLARKRRPQTFEEVVGQAAITQTLANAIRLDRLGHAFLFSGSRGIGKTTTARILAKALNCETGPTPTPCNVCRHCVDITAGKAMDVIEIDGASNRGIDEIRELRENVKYKPVTARSKVVIIDEVHMLTREAFNALLKTLEEPPDHITFILATTEAHKVPVTILSRCQRYDFKRIDVGTLTAYLVDICNKEAITVEERTLEVLARMADGGMRDSLSLLDQVISFSGMTIDHDQTMTLLGRIDPELLHDVFRGIASGNGAKALEKFAFYIDNGGDETVFNREMMEITRDLMAVKVGAVPNSVLPENLPDMLSVDQLERMFRIMLDLEQSFRHTEFPRLLMDISLVKMSRLGQLVPLTEILGFLKNIERHPEFGKFIPPLPQKQTSPSTKHPKPESTPKTPDTPVQTRSPAQKKTDGNDPSLITTPSVPEPLSVHDVSKKPAETAAETEQETTFTHNHTKGDNTPLKQLIDAIPEKAAPVKGMLESASVETFDQETLSLVFSPANRLQYDMLKANDQLSEIFDAATRHAFGKRLDVQCRTGDSSSPPSLRDQETIQRRKSHEDRMDRAMSHPAVEKTLRMFRGTIRDVRVKHSGLKKGSRSVNDGIDTEVDTDD